MPDGILYQDLFNRVLMSPLLSSGEPDTLRIVSGYATYAMASRHLIKTSAERKSLSIDLVYGMAGVDGVRKADHLGFVSLEKHSEFEYDGNFECSYLKRPMSVHSKIYIWSKGAKPSSGQPTTPRTGSLCRAALRAFLNAILCRPSLFSNR